jgi:hypothetical protein
MSVVAQSISFFGATSSHLLASAVPSSRRSAQRPLAALSCANVGVITQAVAAHAQAVAARSIHFFSTLLLASLPAAALLGVRVAA